MFTSAARTVAQPLKFIANNFAVNNSIKRTAKMPLYTKSDDTAKLPEYEFLKLETPSEFVINVQLNRPKQRNALNTQLWKDIGDCFAFLSHDPNCRVVVLSGNGKSFCAGLDFQAMQELGANMMDDSKDVSRRGFALRHLVGQYQQWFTNIEKCPKPVIAAIHGACVGGAVDLITACDIRYASNDAFFSIKEVDIGLAADVGTLQRLPKIIHNEGLVRELAFTAREFGAAEALKMGLLTRTFLTTADMHDAVMALAKQIAAKSPVAVQGSKINLNYARDHSVDEGLEFIRNWNMCHLQSEDLMKSAMAAIQRDKKPPTFAKL